LSDAVIKLEDVNPEHRFAPEVSRGVRAATTQISSWSEEDRSFEFVLATPTPVMRWYRDLDTYERFQAEEVLPIETAVLMSESGRNVPILDSHNIWSVASVVGTCTEMRRENGQIVAKGRLSGMESCKDIVVGVREGVLNNISAGYSECDFELVTDPATSRRTMRAKRWVIYEASLVPVPADGNAKTRSAHDLVVDWRRSQTNNEDSDMTEEQVTALATAAARAVLDEDRKAREAAAAETEKRSKESTEVTTTPTAPTTSERSAEDTAAIAGLRSAAVSYGCEAGFDAMDKAGATVAELRSMVASGARKHSNTPDIDGGSSMGGSRHAEQLPDFGTAFRSAFGGGTK